MSRIFRLIPDAAYSGQENMAIDEMLLEALLANETRPTLRFYSWAPSTVSFGYSQKVEADTVNNICSKGYDVVRRATGGRAVLHHRELTYSFLGLSLESPEPASGFLANNIKDAYNQICRALIAGLEKLGLATELGSSQAQYRSLADCFEASTQADLQINKKKLVGSAQLRRRHGILQHGSLLLDQPQDLMGKLLQLPPIATAEARHANLYDYLPGRPDKALIQAALIEGFKEAFDCEFEVKDLSGDELEKARALKESGRYALKLEEPVNG
jgi:lipoate-protein ligase A